MITWARLCTWPAFLPSDVCLSEWVIVQYFAFKGHYTFVLSHVLKQWVTKHLESIIYSSPPTPQHFLVLQPYSKINYMPHMCSGALFNWVLSHPPWLRPLYQLCSDWSRTHGTVQTFLFTDNGGCRSSGAQMLQIFFSVPFPDLWLSTILFGRSTANTVDFMNWFVLLHALSYLGPCIDMCAPSQIMSNQFKFTADGLQSCAVSPFFI